MKIQSKVLKSILAFSTVLSFISVPQAISVYAAESKVSVEIKDKNIIDFYSLEYLSQAKSWGNEYYSTWINTITELEKKEIGYYAGVGYRDINTYLRNYNGQLLGVKPDIEEKIKRLDYSLQTATLKDTIAVYRRVSETAFGLSNQSLIDQNSQINHDQLQEFKKKFLGKYKKEYAYMSTSIIKDPAPEFSKLPILLRMVVPKGNIAAYIAPLSPSPEEMELLLPRDTSYQITNITPVTQSESPYILIDATVVNIGSGMKNLKLVQ
ncbi:hypothetical protein IGM_01987 [Bacillus cereus HuB4-4]|uniref:ADP ribosyltransferase domain-containing protein n=1 Tax=Bacillus cereus HuB4-4 TaxID=1053211 RepID=A0A9W5QWE6_BACCE|nr:ADP-ribosyltransferase [Bacillus cereus]EOP91341.1 hypothetical protein IGM_01987 [Bacillus cereus HuB4-4]